MNADAPVLDGEVVCLGHDRLLIFNDLPYRLPGTRRLSAFRALRVNGADLRERPLLGLRRPHGMPPVTFDRLKSDWDAVEHRVARDRIDGAVVGEII